MTETSPTDISEEMVEAYICAKHGYYAVHDKAVQIAARKTLEAAAPILRAQDAARIAELERERDDYRSERNAAYYANEQLEGIHKRLERETRAMREALVGAREIIKDDSRTYVKEVLREIDAALAGESAPTRDAEIERLKYQLGREREISRAARAWVNACDSWPYVGGRALIEAIGNAESALRTAIMLNPEEETCPIGESDPDAHEGEVE